MEPGYIQPSNFEVRKQLIGYLDWSLEGTSRAKILR
jgi:hypothetical protein